MFWCFEGCGVILYYICSQFLSGPEWEQLILVKYNGLTVKVKKGLIDHFTYAKISDV